MPAISSILTHRTLERHWQAVLTLTINNSGLDRLGATHFFDHSRSLFGSRPTFWEPLAQQFYIKSFAFSFHMHSSVCSLLSIRESALSQIFMTFWNSKPWECMLQNTPQLAPAVTATRPGERGEQADTPHSASSKGSEKPVLWITRCNSGQFYAALSEDFCAHKILSLKFVQTVADDQRTFAQFLHFFHCLLLFERTSAIRNVAIQSLSF